LSWFFIDSSLLLELNLTIYNMQEIPTDLVVTEIEPIAHEFGRMYDVIDISSSTHFYKLLLIISMILLNKNFNN